MAMRKAAFEIGLELYCPALHVPGAIRELTRQKTRYASLISPIRRWHSASQVQCVQRLTCRVGIAGKALPLGSSSIGRLLGLQPARQCLQPTRSISGPCKTQQLHNGLFIGLGLLFPQPLPRPLDLSGALPLPSWGSIQLNRPKGVAGLGDGTVFQGRPTRTAAGDSTAIWPAVRSKAAVVMLPIMRAMGRKSVTGVNCAWTTT